MRESAPPCGDLPWKQVNLQAVDATAAHKIYASWHPEGRDDPNVPPLLAKIGHMPLAVMLLAKKAKSTRISAESLVEEYNQQGTVVVGQGFDAETSMEICIGLSVDSSRMKARPEAFLLLCILSMLPVGTTYKMLSEWWARDLPNLTGALEVLKSTALVEHRGNTFTVLPVVQRYILHTSRFLPQVQLAMTETACAFLKEHDSKVGDPRYKDDTAVLSAEDGNLEAVLLTTTAPDPSVIRDGLLLLARHQSNHRPRVDVIGHALSIARSLDDEVLQGDIHFYFGNILYRLQDYAKSVDFLREALRLFLAARNDKRKVIECRLHLANSLRLASNTWREREKLIMEAQEDSKTIHDQLFIGRCLHELGKLHWSFTEYSTAISFLNQAEPLLTQDPYQHVACLQTFTWCYYWIGDFDTAYYQCAAPAFDQSIKMGDVRSRSYMAFDVGWVLSARGDYKGSLKALLQSLELRKSMGLEPSGYALEGIALAWIKLRKIKDARWAFQQAKLVYNTSADERKSDCGKLYRIQFFLKRLDDPCIYPTDNELSALNCLYSHNHIERILTP
ncbi:hypothetical protein H0H87_000960 [Tephrocybe sp. NHM501043]|nr:hypothetical protein H0H87_000960 [Tephrocybe sp. NHM501043]